MDQEDEFNLIDRIESNAPNLKPVDYICCSEVVDMSKPNFCENFISNVPLSQMRCLPETRQQEKPCSPPAEIHERDILFQPIRWRCKIPSKAVTEKTYTPSLGAPIGLSKSAFSMNFLESKSSDQFLQGFSTLLIAFAEYFITPEIEWDEQVINRILLEGQRLYADSKTKLPEGEQLKEAKINRDFILCGNTFGVMVNNPFLIGRVIGDESQVPNLHWGLLKFFKKFQFCLLHIGNWYILLWKNFDLYFVFDCFGRRIQDFKSDQKKGLAMLLCLRNLDNVSHLIMNLSGIQPDHLFTIRDLQIKSLIPCGGKPPADTVDRSNQFEIINSDYALLRGTIHLGSNCFKEIRHRHSLPVAISALINAKIDATPTWDSAVLDKIIKLGAQLYKQWTNCDLSLDLGIQDVPSRFVFGQFMVQVAVNAFTECGLWKCTPNYRHSGLTLALKRAFENGSNLLIQIQGRSYAMWRKGSFYYVMDPYSHQCSLGKSKMVTASLRMCGTIDKMCCIFTQALLELFEESRFIIQRVKILQVEELNKMEENRRQVQVPCMCLATPQTDDAAEVISLNESVIGVDGFECAVETPAVESDSGDLDSPGLSQTRLEDYTDLRRGFIEESEEESEEDEDDTDLDAISINIEPSDETDESDDGSSGHAAPARKPKHKSKKQSDANSEKKSRKDETQGKAFDGNEGKKRGRKRDRKTSDDEADDEMEKSKKKKRKKKTKDDKKEKKNKSKTNRGSSESESAENKKDKISKKAEKNKRAGKDGNPAKDAESDKDETNKNKNLNRKDKQKKDDTANRSREKKEKVDKARAREDKKADKDNNPKKDEGNGKILGNNDENKNKINNEKNNYDSDKTNDKPDNNKEKTKSDESKNRTPTDQDAPSDERRSKGERQSEQRSLTALTPSKTPSRRQRHQRRKQQDGDDTSSDEIPRDGIPAGCKPNSYPGFTEDPQDLAVVGSESGSYESLCSLFKSAFRCADRVLTMTPWGNYVAFHSNNAYFIFDGCTCNLRSIRHMDLSVGTAGLLCFPDVHSLIKYIESGKEARRPTTSSKRDIIDQICSEYCDP